jgi:hypothetical protein
MTELVEHLPSKYKALISNPVLAKKEENLRRI